MSSDRESLGSGGGCSNPFEPSLPIRFLATCLIRLGCIRERKYFDKGWKSYAENLQFKVLRIFYTLTSRRHLDYLMQQLDDIRASRLFEQLSANDKERDKNPSEVLSFKHSGNAGDLIYSLPVIRELSKESPAKIHLRLDAPINNWSLHQHPLGRSGLTAEMVAFLKPLLEYQPWVKSVQIHTGEPIDYDLDIFRRISSIRAGRGHIAHWYFWIFPVASNLSNPWLDAPPLEAAGNRILLARSSRYRNPHLDYRFLQELGEIDFIGTASEFEEMRKILPHLHHVHCSDALQMARVIRSARFFIGNQSFPFALAEALKVPRILEVCPQTPDVIPTGDHIGAAYFQQNFEVLVRQFIDNTKKS